MSTTTAGRLPAPRRSMTLSGTTIPVLLPAAATVVSNAMLAGTFSPFRVNQAKVRAVRGEPPLAWLLAPSTYHVYHPAGPGNGSGRSRIPPQVKEVAGHLPGRRHRRLPDRVSHVLPHSGG